MSEKREQELLASVPQELFIGGRWRAAEGGETLDVRDPATGEVLRTIASASSADAQAAMDATADAFPAWSRTPARERGELLRRAFDLLTERAEDFALLMTLEMGKPLAESRGEVTYGGEFLRWFGEEAVRIQGGYGPNPENTGRAIVSRHPVGPCYLITPWNFPLAMATRKIAPALAAGCTVVIKPAQLTPLTTLLFVQLLEEAGLPEGVVDDCPGARGRLHRGAQARAAHAADHAALREAARGGRAARGRGQRGDLELLEHRLRADPGRSAAAQALLHRLHRGGAEAPVP